MAQVNLTDPCVDSVALSFTSNAQACAGCERMIESFELRWIANISAIGGHFTFHAHQSCAINGLTLAERQAIAAKRAHK